MPDELPIPEIPTATYRLQFNKGFTFNQAREIVPYLKDLGISHVYASPYFTAPAESMHGYDICDHNSLNAAIGTREEYDALIATLHTHGMGQIADFVPNHMGIVTPLNAWWMDVLENGPSSLFASHFDIEWHPVKEQLHNKVLLPMLGDQYGRVLERGELKLALDGGAFFIRYFQAKLPVEPRSCLMILRPAFERMTASETTPEARLEMQSIMTALEHLPECTQPLPERLEERAREKEIIKNRLARVCVECPPVLEIIDATMRDMEGRPGDAKSFDALDQLLGAQVFRLSDWRVAAEEINHRRFFDINDLAAIRVELPEVFEATHRLVMELIGNGSIDGLRIDHVDGLWHPRGYLQQLRQRWGEVLGDSDKADRAYLLVEKIVMGEERLRADWPVQGTTGYEFANEVTGLFIDSAAEKAVSDTYAKFTSATRRFEDIVYQTKLLTMRRALSSEVNMLGHMLSRLAVKNRWYRDFTLNALTDAVREIAACFPVYRAYLAPGEEPAQGDREAVLRAVLLAKRRNPSIERSLFNFLGEVLLGKYPQNLDDAGREAHMRFVLKFQQCTGPVMAKGVEDTAFYIFNRLVALNEVGGDPERFGMSPDAFFERCSRRLASHPHSMLATTTHDTKRSEDARARIAVLSEIPADWHKALRQWATNNRRFKRRVDGHTAPDANEEYLLYQTLLGAWPDEALTAETRDTFIARIQDYMIKAIKEAKVNSRWIQPNDEWESAVREFVHTILQPENHFVPAFAPLAAQVSRHGVVNSLAQLVLKSTVPGMPDFYQGCELWDLSLVDPDNRRPVDYEKRRALIASLPEDPADLMREWPDGRVKLFITRALLRMRAAHPALFQKGDLIPLTATGAFASSCVAFRRSLEGTSLIVVVPRLSCRIGFPPIGDAWKDTAITLPDGATGLVRDLFTGRETAPRAGALRLADVLRDLPVSVLVSAA